MEDLWGEPVKDKPVKVKREQPEPLGFYTTCYKCGKRVRAENSVPVALHTDYCKKCYQEHGKPMTEEEAFELEDLIFSTYDGVLELRGLESGRDLVKKDRKGIYYVSCWDVEKRKTVRIYSYNDLGMAYSFPSGLHYGYGGEV